jgi:hypothetical protein
MQYHVYRVAIVQLVNGLMLHTVAVVHTMENPLILLLLLVLVDVEILIILHVVKPVVLQQSVVLLDALLGGLVAVHQDNQVLRLQAVLLKPPVVVLVLTVKTNLL